MPYTLTSLEKALGYPLDPSDWGNMYLETGKTQDECACPDADADLDDADAYDEDDGKFRLFNWNPEDQYLAIDPATEVNAVKLVKETVAYKTFETDEYRIHWLNGAPQYTKFLEVVDCGRWLPACWWDYARRRPLQLAVQAEWLDLSGQQTALEAAHTKFANDIRSESLGSHSYTKFDKSQADSATQEILLWAGPNGTAKRRRIV